MGFKQFLKFNSSTLATKNYVDICAYSEHNAHILFDQQIPWFSIRLISEMDSSVLCQMEIYESFVGTKSFK